MPKKRTKKIKVGVVGAARGKAFGVAAGAKLEMELVALCDTWQRRLEQVGEQLDVATYADFDEFLQHDMDAVILANYFHEHTRLAVKALKAGKHVMSETTACFTPAEGVALVEAVEKSGKIYMLAENYPYMVFNQEMRRIFRTGKIGTFMYGEGEYVHPESADFWNSISNGIDHWRNWIPATYYCTHSLGPIMYITDTRPVKVNGLVMPHCDDDPVTQRCPRRNDDASMIALRMNNGAVVKLLQMWRRGESVWTRIHGSRGQMENLRHGNTQKVRIRREQYHQRRTGPVDQTYLPEFPKHHQEAMKATHGGGDFFMNYHFAEAIRKNTPPYFDVYRGVAMSLVGILAYRSALNDSNALEIPDFRKKSVRRRYADDRWSPDPGQRKKGDPWPSIKGDVKPGEKAMAYARRNWDRYLDL